MTHFNAFKGFLALGLAALLSAASVTQAVAATSAQNNCPITNFSVTNITASGARVNFQNTLSSFATIRYRVQASSGDWTMLNNVQGTGFSIAGLQPGTTYTVQVSPNTANCQGSFNNSINFTTAAQAVTNGCRTPSNIRVNMSGCGNSAIVSWSQVTGAVCYRLGWSLVGQTIQNEMGISACNTSHTLNGLEANKVYRVVMRTNCTSCSTITATHKLSPYSVSVPFLNTAGAFAKVDGSEEEFLFSTGSQSGLSVYPNPTKGAVNVKFMSVSGMATYRIFDLTGRQLKMETVSLNEGQTEVALDLETYAPGFYFLDAVLPSGERLQTKIEKQN